MVSLYNYIFASLFFIYLLQQVQDFAVWIWVPAIVSCAELCLHTSQVEATLNLCCKIFSHIFTSRTNKDFKVSIVCINVYYGKVRRCFNNVRISRNHTQNAIVDCIDSVDDVVLDFCRNKCSRLFCVFNKEFDVAFNRFKLAFNQLTLCFHHFLECCNFVFSQCKYNFCLERNGIAHIATLPYS